jgi:hypothetical protein
MAQLDPSIILQDIAPKLEDPQNMLAKRLQIQGLQQQQQENAFKMQQDRDAYAQSNQLAQLLGRQGFDPKSAEGQAELYRTGGVKGAQGVLKSNADLYKTNADAMKIGLENGMKKFELMGQIMGGVTDQVTYDRMRAQAAQIPELADLAPKMPAVYDPAAIKQGYAQAMTQKERMEQQYKDLTLAETGRHNLATEQNSNFGQQVTMRGQDMSAKTSLRGQDMTDARARDLNATRVEDNRIKREAKDDANNLTKQGQLASFDTMLGTLDRLGKHPGLSRSVGVMGALPTVPGSDSANFQAELNTFQSQAFLPMVAQLKGMGALSDAEGKRLTQAVGALDPKMGEKAFRESVQRITDEMAAAKTRVQSSGKPMANMASQDTAAMQWARANPNDPRSAQILKHLGQ